MLKKKATVCNEWEVSRSGLDKLFARFPDIAPKPIKFGTSRQSPVFFDCDELDSFLATIKAARLPQAANDKCIDGEA